MSKILAAVVLMLWILLPAVSATAQPPELLPLEGTYNVRDLGGYPVAGNTKVKSGLVYRAGDLNKLSAWDLKLLEERSIRTIVDFRTKKEKSKAPHKVPATVKRTVALEIDPGNISAFGSITEENAPQFMTALNRALMNDNQRQYAAFFKTLANPANTPLLFNCSAGKDRTGLAAALFLASLGVDRKTIFQDYLLSAEFLIDKYENEVKARPRPPLHRAA